MKKSNRGVTPLGISTVQKQFNCNLLREDTDRRNRRAMAVALSARFATAICKITDARATAFGKYRIAGTVPATCMHDNGTGTNCRIFSTEWDALTAILADPWIKANPAHPIQLDDCTFYVRCGAPTPNAHGHGAVFALALVGIPKGKRDGEGYNSLLKFQRRGTWGSRGQRTEHQLQRENACNPVVAALIDASEVL